MRRSLRAVVGLGPVGTGGHDRLERGAGRAQAPHLEVEVEGDLPLGGALGQAGPDLGQGVVGDAGGLGHAGHLARVLGPAQVLDQALGGDELGVGEPLGGEAALLGPGDVVGLQAQPGDAGRGRLQVVLLGPAGEADVEVEVDARRRQLLDGLVAVAAVGDEEQPVVGEQDDGRRAGEPGEVADVDQVGEEQGVASGAGEEAPQPVDPGGDVHAGEFRGGKSVIPTTLPRPRPPVRTRGP